MGTAADKLKELGVNQDLAKAVGFAEDVYSKVSWAYGAYSTAKDLLVSLGFLGKPDDPLEKISEQLKNIELKLDMVLSELADVKEKLLAGFKLMTLREIGDKLAYAYVAAYKAKAYLEAKIKSGDGQIHPEIENAFFDAQNDSWEVAGSLSQNEHYWMRLFAEEAVYSDGWSGALKPEVEGNYVWDYRLALAAYLQIVANRVIVYLVSDPDDYQKNEVILQSMRTYADHLRKEYDKILKSFTPIRPPDYEEMKYLIPFMDDVNFWYDYSEINPLYSKTYIKRYDFSSYEIDFFLKERIPGGRWRPEKYLYGVVEKYSGYFCSGAYPQDEIRAGSQYLSIPQSFEYKGMQHNEAWWDWWKAKLVVAQPEAFRAFYNQFVARHAVRTLKLRKQLYVELGLPKVRETILHLYSMFEPTKLLADPIAWTDPAAWSVRDAYTGIERAVKKSNPAPGAQVSLRAIAAVLEPKMVNSPIISLRQMFLLDENITYV